MGPVCPACLEALGAYRPDKFPTLDEFETAKLRFPGPIWEDLEAASDTLEQGAPHRVALEASRIGRAGAPSAE